MSVQGQLALLRLVSPALAGRGVLVFARARGRRRGRLGARRGQSVEAWILGVLEHAVAPLEGAVLCRLHRAFVADDGAEVARWTRVLAGEPRERGALARGRADGARARAAAAVARSVAELARAARLPQGFAAMFALAAVRWGVAEHDALAGFLWSAAESQVERRDAAPAARPDRGPAHPRARAPDASSAARRDAAALDDDDDRQLQRRASRSRAPGTRPSIRGSFVHEESAMALGTSSGRGRTGRFGQDGARAAAVRGAARPPQHRRRDQRHLHQGGRAVPDARQRAAARAHRRRRDRRLPAHRDPRGRIDQPDRGRRA